MPKKNINFCDTCKHWNILKVFDNPLITKHHDFPQIPINERVLWGTCDTQPGCAYGGRWYCAGWAYGRKEKNVTHNKSKNGYRQKDNINYARDLPKY